MFLDRNKSKAEEGHKSLRFFFSSQPRHLRLIRFSSLATPLRSHFSRKPHAIAPTLFHQNCVHTLQASSSSIFLPCQLQVLLATSCTPSSTRMLNKRALDWLKMKCQKCMAVIEKNIVSTGSAEDPGCWGARLRLRNQRDRRLQRVAGVVRLCC